MAVAGDGAEEILGLLVADGAHAGPPPVRTGTDPGVIAVAPVGQIVAALGAGAGVVGDFIGRDARGGGAGLGQFEQDCAGLGIERIELAFGDHRGEAGAGLDGQLVEG